MGERIRIGERIDQVGSNVPIFTIKHDALTGVESFNQESRELSRKPLAFLNIIQAGETNRSWLIRPKVDVAKRAFYREKFFTIRVASGPSATIDVFLVDDPVETGPRFYSVFVYNPSTKQIEQVRDDQMPLFRRIWEIVILPVFSYEDDRSLRLIIADKEDLKRGWENFMRYLYRRP